MPDYTRLENPETNLATEIISSDDQTLGKFYFDDNRTPIGFEDLPKNLVDALVALKIHVSMNIQVLTVVERLELFSF